MCKVITDIKQPEEYSINELKSIFNESRSFRDVYRKLSWDSRKRNKLTSINTLIPFAEKIGLTEIDLENDNIVKRYNESRKLEKYCLQCGKLIDENRAKCGAKFCNSSCSATYNNYHRTPYTNELKHKISEGLLKYYSELNNPESNIENVDCKYINKNISHFTYKKRICKVCKKNIFYKNLGVLMVQQKYVVQADVVKN